MKLTIVIGLLLLSTTAFAQDLTGTLPDPTLTPGVIATSSWNDICNSHLSRNRDVSESEKKEVYKEYNTSPNSDLCNRVATSGSRKSKAAGCEVDHLLPLEVGGSNDVKNLWPEPYGGEWNARMKDKLENRSHKLICEKQITNDQVKVIQEKLMNNWQYFYKEQFGDK